MTPESTAIPPHFLVIVPGIMGSRLRSRTSGEVAWIDLSHLPANPLAWDGWVQSFIGRLAYPNPDLEPDGIMDEVVFVPPWAKQEAYGRLLRALEGMGYRADPAQHESADLNVHTFAYDWRQDNRISARQLGEAITAWRAQHDGAPAWILAHSMGGLVSRWYIEKEGGKDHVGRLFLLASPWDGSPKSLQVLQTGLDTLFRRVFNLFDVGGRTRALMRTLPSAYQLLPHKDPFLRGVDNEVLDLTADPRWLATDAERALLLDARRFNEDLDVVPSVPTLCFFGRKQPTTTQGTVKRGPEGSWGPITWSATEAGDGTVPERSAVHPHAAEKLPFVASHGDIYVNPALLEFLQWELVGQYGAGTRAFISTGHLAINFLPTQDTYSPGERIELWATVNDETQEGTPPVLDAIVSAELRWRAPLPGQSEPPTGARLPRTDLAPSPATPGRYEGALVAPSTEGYYVVQATVVAGDQPPVDISELIAVEALPTPPAEGAAPDSG
ncbi:MAG TPA: hypothetical protein VM536_23410 [Chloroflexia bacterium]|nr:hypothetical protein [Chloroflexia bacterium]